MGEQIPMSSDPAQLVLDFAQKIRREIWPGRRLPFYYDRARSTLIASAAPSCMPRPSLLMRAMHC